MKGVACKASTCWAEHWTHWEMHSTNSCRVQSTSHQTATLLITYVYYIDICAPSADGRGDKLIWWIRLHLVTRLTKGAEMWNIPRRQRMFCFHHYWVSTVSLKVPSTPDGQLIYIRNPSVNVPVGGLMTVFPCYHISSVSLSSSDAHLIQLHLMTGPQSPRTHLLLLLILLI